MAGVASITSRHNPHTGTSDTSVSYTTACTSDQDQSDNLFSTSLTSETPILQDSRDTSMLSTPDSFAFVNDSYSSPIGTRKTHRTCVLPEVEEAEDGDKENIINSVNRRSGLMSNDIAVRGLRFIDSVHRLSVPSSMRPQIHIRLMRAKSPSNESILNQDDSFQSEDTTEAVSVSIDNSDIKSKAMSTPYIPQKRRWYLQKVGALFKRKSSKSLNNLASQSTDDLSSQNSAQTHVSTILKSQSYSSIPDIVEPRSERQTKAQIKEKMKTIHGILREGVTKKDTESKRSENVRFRTEQSMDMGENSITNNNKLPAGHRQVQVKVHTPERSYSLIRQESQRNDSSRVNFTRIPSLRRRKFHLDLHHQFTTAFTPQEDGEVHAIKDATHIQPLENGNAFVTDILCNNLVLFGADGHPKITFSLEAGSEPYATCLASDGCLAVTLKRQGCVALWSTAGEPITEFGQTVLSGPTGIQCDNQSRFIVADELANEVLIFSKDGEPLTKLTPPMPEMEPNLKTSPLTQGFTSSSTHLYQPFFKQPRYVCLTHSGNYVIADSANHCIKIFDQDMHFVSQFGSYGRGDGCFKFPYGVASDAEGNLYVADHFNNRVSIFSAEGEFIQHLLTLQDGIARPKSIAVYRSLLYVTHGDIRASKVSVFTLRS